MKNIKRWFQTKCICTLVVQEYLKEYGSYLCVQKNGMTFWTKWPKKEKLKWKSREDLKRKLKKKVSAYYYMVFRKLKWFFYVFLCFQFNDFVCELKYNFSLFWECLRVHVVGYFCPLIIQQVFTEMVKFVILLSPDSVITKCHSL